MIINREWEMPNKNTFDIKCIKRMIIRHMPLTGTIIDPFANKNTMANVTNDLDTRYKTTYNIDALEFLGKFKTNSVDCVLYDPPYSPRQVSEIYKKLDKSVNFETTNASYWSKQKKSISEILKPGGKCISFGWNSNGIGAVRGFKIVEILIVAHGGQHNDTICVVEEKADGQQYLF